MNIKFHPLTYIFLLISFLSGYFEYIYLLLIVILVHEMGHCIFSMIVNIKVKEIVIYPFGGITILNAPLNTKIYKELISLIGGITFQLLFYFLIYTLYINNHVTYHVFNIIDKINHYLILFNFMPCLPLDGGRLLNLLTDVLFDYKTSYKITIFISYITSIIFVIINHTIFAIILFLFLIKSIYYEQNNIETKYNNFIFERYKTKYNFSKIKYIKNINKLKRDYYHIINGKSEDEIVSKMFDKHTYIC